MIQPGVTGPLGRQFGASGSGGSGGDSLEQELSNLLAKALSTAASGAGTVTASKLEAASPTILALGLDKFVRETPGGKDVVKKLSLYTVLPTFAAGAVVGYLVCKIASSGTKSS